MAELYRTKLDILIDDFSLFLEKNYSSRFKELTEKEDRQLFFLARILTRLKHISEDIKEKEKILIHPTLQKLGKA